VGKNCRQRSAHHIFYDKNWSEPKLRIFSEEDLPEVNQENAHHIFG
jgi:hypothetical protein